MGIVEIIKAALWQDKEAGMNQSEIARKYNLNQQTVNRIFHEKINLAKLELRTFIRMFPNAELILHETLGENPPDAIYPLTEVNLIDGGSENDTVAENQNDDFDLSFLDRAMLEEWYKLCQQDKCRVMGYIAKLIFESENESRPGYSGIA